MPINFKSIYFHVHYVQLGADIEKFVDFMLRDASDSNFATIIDKFSWKTLKTFLVIARKMSVVNLTPACPSQCCFHMDEHKRFAREAASSGADYGG